MNVRIFWVCAVKCMSAQTRPRFILSSERVFGGMEFEPMLTPREKSPLLENVPRGGSNPRRCGQRAQALPTELFRPLFYKSSFKNSEQTHIFNYTDSLQNWHTITLRRLYFVYICYSRSGLKTTEHFLQKQHSVCAAFADAKVSFLEQLLSGRSLFPCFRAFFLPFVAFVQPLVTKSFEFKPAISEDG